MDLIDVERFFQSRVGGCSQTEGVALVNFGLGEGLFAVAENGEVFVWFVERWVEGNGFLKMEFSILVIVAASRDIAQNDVGFGVLRLHGE